MRETITKLSNVDGKVNWTVQPATAGGRLNNTTQGERKMSETTTTTAPKVKTPKEPKPLNVCWSGCGGTTKNRFAPGMDARFHGWAKKVARGEMDETETLAKLPHDESRALFLTCVAKERPLAAAKKAEQEQKAAEKLRKLAEKEAAKQAADAAKVKPESETVESETESPVAA